MEKFTAKFKSETNSPTISQANEGRLLLAKLGGGSYAHPGNKEATDLVFQKILQLSPSIQNGNCLDVGSGFGGTANDIYNFGFKHVYGIDVDKEAISYAQKCYPELQFSCMGAESISNKFPRQFFSLIYLFNVIYNFKDKLAILKNFACVAKEGAILAIYDIHVSQRKDEPLWDLGGNPTYPMQLDSLREDLHASGWEIVEITDLSDQYVIWYRELLQRLSQEHSKLLEEFSEEVIKKVTTIIQPLLLGLENSSLGAAVVYARRSSLTER